MKGYKVKFTYPVTLFIALTCVVLYIANTLTLGWLNSILLSVYRTTWTSPILYVRMFMHSFGHLSVAHLVGNLTLWLLVAPVIEERIGGVRLLSYAISTSFIIGLVQVLLFPNTALCGLSGVIFMCVVLSAYGDTKGEKVIPVTVILVILLWIGREVYDSVTVNDNVSQFSHLLGGLCGFLYGLRNDT